MSAESIQRLIAAVREDPDLKGRISQSKSLQEAIDILAAAGYQIDPGDFIELIRRSMPNLSDEELEGMIIPGTASITVIISAIGLK